MVTRKKSAAQDLGRGLDKLDLEADPFFNFQGLDILPFQVLPQPHKRHNKNKRRREPSPPRTILNTSGCPANQAITARLPP